ncbi:MAG: hypothetical protein RDV00_10680 [Clostridia bacterium]|nr:hypothetical protein [Clostridia bacterium]MDQ7792567.1 hypothetical protein [Clostridia bacterium]
MSVYSKEKLIGKLSGGTSRVEPPKKAQNGHLTRSAEDASPKDEPVTDHTYGGRRTDSELIEGLERLIQKLDQLESRQATDRKLIDEALTKVEKLVEEPKPVEVQQVQLKDNLKKWLGIAQASGKILDVGAGTMIVIIDAVADSLKDRNYAGAQSPPGNQLDLQNLLVTVTQFLQELNPDVRKASPE